MAQPTAPFEVSSFGAQSYALAGEFDMAAVPSLDRMVVDMGPQPVVIDVSAVEFMDGTMLAFFSDVREHIAPACLTIHGARGAVARLLDLAVDRWNAPDGFHVIPCEVLAPPRAA